MMGEPRPAVLSSSIHKCHVYVVLSSTGVIEEARSSIPYCECEKTSGSLHRHHDCRQAIFRHGSEDAQKHVDDCQICGRDDVLAIF